MYVVNPDHASKRVHCEPKSDGRCHIKRISNPIRYEELEKIPECKYPNNCKICMG